MKKLTMLLSLLCLTAALAVPASALEYDICLLYTSDAADEL